MDAKAFLPMIDQINPSLDCVAARRHWLPRTAGDVLDYLRKVCKGAGAERHDRAVDVDPGVDQLLHGIPLKSHLPKA